MTLPFMGSRRCGAVAMLWLLAGGCGTSEAQNTPPHGIIIVSIDTLRADATSPYGAPADRTPNMARLAAESIVFDNVFAQSNETLPSHASLFTSQLPSHLGPVNYDLTIPDGTPTLASALRDAGWNTAAVVAGGHLARIFGLDDGFGLYVEGRRWGSFQETLPMGVRWLEQAVQGDAPFYLFLHSYDCHGPYTKPGLFGLQGSPGYDGAMLNSAHNPQTYTRIYGSAYFPEFPLERIENSKGEIVLKKGERTALPAWAQTDVPRVTLGPEDQAFLRGLYTTGVVYADLWLGVLLDELDRMGIADTTTLIVLSDHGEDTLNHGFMGHRIELHDATTQVPLMVRLPKAQRRTGRVKDLAQLLDVAPTVLGLAGVAVPDSMEGLSLQGCIVGEGCTTSGVAVSEAVDQLVSATDGRFRLTVDGLEAHDVAVDAAMAHPTAPQVQLWDVGGPPGSDTELPLEKLPAARIQQLADLARAQRAR